MEFEEEYILRDETLYDINEDLRAFGIELICTSDNSISFHYIH